MRASATLGTASGQPARYEARTFFPWARAATASPGRRGPRGVNASGRRPTSLARSRAAAAAAAVALFATACGGSAVSSSSDAADSGPLKVGLLIPLSGPYTSIGEDVKCGFELYLDQQDQELGGRPVELVPADTAGSPATGIPAAQRLLNESGVSVVTGVVSSAVAGGVRDIFDSAKVPLVLSVAATSGAPSDYVYRTSQTTRQPGAALGPYLAEENIGSVYVIGADYVAGRDNIAAFADAYTEAGGTIAGESFTPFQQTQDWQPYLAQIRDSGADAVYAFYAGSEAVNFVRQYDAFGLKESIPLYGPGFLTDADALEAQGESAIGVRTSNNYSAALENTLNEEFVEAYTEKCGALPSTYSVQSYDSAQLLGEAVSAVEGSVTGEKLADALESVEEIESPRGALAFDEDNNPTQEFYLFEVVDTGGELVNELVAELGSVPAS